MDAPRTRIDYSALYIIYFVQSLLRLLPTSRSAPSPRRGPSGRGPFYPRAANLEQALSGEGVHHRHVLIDRACCPLEGKISLDRSSRRGFTGKTEATKRLGALEVESCERGWKAQGMLAGEWKDRLGRQRRALPFEATPAQSARAGTCHESVSSSCAATEISFERLLEELRERLPRSPHMELVAAQTTGGVNTAGVIDSGNVDRRGQESDKRHRHDSRGWDAIAAGGPPGRAIYEAATPAAPLDKKRESQPSRDGRLRDSGASPPSTVSRGGMLTREETFTRSSRYVVVRPRVGNSSGQPTGSWASPLLAHKTKAPYPSRYGGISRLPAAAASGDEASPSAAMVAAAKAQERALPLLQVCATNFMDFPTP